MDKSQLRREIRAKRLSSEYVEYASSVIAKKVLSSAEFINCSSLFIYASTKTEPTTDAVIAAALRMGKRVYLPKCVSDGEMTAIKINDISELKSGYMGIREPCGSETAESFDLCIVPCLAASLCGKRLGHGGGFYDRFLSGRRTYKMCLCFEDNILKNIPTDIHDIDMDSVITEK